jgi:hypothetical protein
MNEKLAKRARRKVRALARIMETHGPPKSGSWWEDVWLRLFLTPRQRRRAEAVVARRPKGTK